MSELVTVSIDVNKLHTCTTAIVVESGSLTQVNGNTLLRVDTMKGIMQEEVDRVNKALYRRKNEPVEAPQPVQYPSAPPAMPPTAEAGEVKLNAFEFSNLLSSLKQVGTSSATNRQVLTHMEIHEKLLAMKVHK